MLVGWCRYIVIIFNWEKGIGSYLELSIVLGIEDLVIW